jgi:hypothetical protein
LDALIEGLEIPAEKEEAKPSPTATPIPTQAATMAPTKAMVPPPLPPAQTAIPVPTAAATADSAQDSELDELLRDLELPAVPESQGNTSNPSLPDELDLPDL